MVFRECNIFNIMYFSNIYDPVATALTVSHRSQSGNNGIRLIRNGVSQLIAIDTTTDSYI